MVAIGAVLALAVTACGGDEDATTDVTDSDTTSSIDPVDTSPATTSLTTTAVTTVPETTDPGSSTTAPTESSAGSTTTAPSTSDPSSTTDVTSTVVSPTTTAAPPTAGAALAAWPDPPAPPELADVPYLLPAAPIPGVVEGIRFAETRPPNDAVATQYLEVWRADGSPIALDVTTLLDVDPDPLEILEPEPVEVEGWSEARLIELGDGSLSLQLIDDGGYVSLDARGIGTDDLLRIGRSLRPAGNVGWTITNAPLGLRRVDGGWWASTTGSAYREIDWYGAEGRLEAELAISAYDPQRFRIGDIPDVAYQLADVGGATALVTEWQPSGPVFVVWSPEPDLVVSFSSMQSLDDAIATARSIVEVDEATWDSVSMVEPQRDGCQSFVC